jgi:protein required for attachment to host cells
MPYQWLLIADGSRARLFEADAAFGSLVLVVELDHPAAREHARDLVSDGPGVMQGGAPGIEAATYDPPDPVEVEMERFAAEVAAVLEKGRVEHRFRRLAIAAGPRFLGRLRKEFRAPLTATVTHAVPHDFTHLPERELPHAIRRALVRLGEPVQNAG